MDKGTSLPFGHMDRCHACRGTGKRKGHKCIVCMGRGMVVAASYICLCICGCTKYALMIVCDDCVTKQCKEAPKKQSL
jgi:DnaJ-class molecular chaperone